MVFTERDELLENRRRKQNPVSKLSIIFIGSVAVIALISVSVLLTRSPANASKSEQVLLLGEGEDDGTVDETDQYSNTRSQRKGSQRKGSQRGGSQPDGSQSDRSRGQNSSFPVVTTPLGKVIGVTLKSRAGRDYKGFYNVPYAEPPIGELRFQPPLPVKPWKGTLNCTVKGSMCVQPSRYNPDVEYEGTEDCLHVNLFTPKVPQRYRNQNSTNYPVIVYFFGGRFMHGTANEFGMDYVMDEDIVMVIVESRVGALGFLNTGDMSARGNQGLKDQVMALRWVKENIASFGGDPTRVVAFGTSSGGMSSHAHLLSPMSKDLFSGVMSFSGTMFDGVFEANPKLTAKAFGEAMNCSDVENSVELLKCLRNVTTEAIVLGQPLFSPSLEAIPTDGNMSDVFFPDTPANLLLSGRANSVPWLVGVNSAESILQSYSMLLDPNTTASLNTDWKTVFPILLQLDDVNKTLIDDVVSSIHEFYFGNRTISGDSDTRFNLTDLISDRTHIHPTKTAGLIQSKQSPVYWYYLTKEANVSWAADVEQYYDPPYGVSHADEVQYFFIEPRYPYIPLDSEYADFSILLVKLWTSFARTGAPVNPDTNGVVWPKVDPNGDGTVWYNLDDVPKLIEPFTERLHLWDTFPFTLLYNNYNQTTTIPLEL